MSTRDMFQASVMATDPDPRLMRAIHHAVYDATDIDATTERICMSFARYGLAISWINPPTAQQNLRHAIENLNATLIRARNP